MASPDFPNNLITNTYILNDYLEIAYIVCTGALPPNVEKPKNVSDPSSRERALDKLNNARQQFRQASILVVLDAEALELVTFYKKADIVKDQQAILAKFTNICRVNLCKIERKNACRVVDLVKPELARTWRLFSEAILSSLALQTPAGRKVLNINTNIYLVPEFETASNDGCTRLHCETRYYLRRADLQIVMPGHLLLALRDSAWPPLHALTDIIDVDVPSWRLRMDSILYLIPTGQLARYKGGWVGNPNSTDIRTPQHSGRNGDNNHRLRWVDKVRQWLGAQHQQYTQPSHDTVWCSVEIPIHESSDGQWTDQGPLVWKTVIWPVDLLFVFQTEGEAILQDENEDNLSDPLTTAQAWFVKDLADVRAAAAAAASKDLLKPTMEAALNDGNLFDDDTQFGSPQHFMSLPAQNFQPSHLVYPTPPDAMNPQHTPGISMDGAAQTPMSNQLIQPSIYQSSPLAMAGDPEASRSHESAISSFLKHNDDDLFEDEEEDQKLVQPSFGDEPNWDFFDRDTTTIDMKAELDFGELNASPLPDKSPDLEQEAHPKSAQPESVKQESSGQEMLNREPARVVSVSQTKDQPLVGSVDVNVPDADILDTSATLPTAVRDFAHHGAGDSHAESLPPRTKRRRSSAYDVTPQPQDGHDHKYAPSGKYHFELRRASSATKDEPDPGQLNRYSSSSSMSSQSSSSQATSGEEERNSDGHLKSWTRYEPGNTNETLGMHIDDAHEDLSGDAEIDELLGVIATASGSEAFTSISPLQQNHGRKAAGRKSLERWLMIAQILTEQLTQSSVFRSYEELQLPRTRPSPPFDVYVESVEIGTSATNASISDLTSIQRAGNNVKLGTHVLVLEPNRIRLRQGESEISAELPIIKYWETLNLQPLSGPKNVHALCLHPGGSNYLQGCDSFMRRMEETYTSCNLGTHRRLKSKGLTDSGLLSWDHAPGKRSLSALCRSIGKSLASKSNKGCTVVYVTLPSDKLFASIEICDAFLELFEALGQIDHAPENDIVLQLIPSSFVIGASNLVVRPQKQYTDLAIEVYNRTPCLKSSSAAVTAGAMTLEKLVSRSLHFELNSKATSPSLGAGSCYHVAYCTSTDHKWLVASWSDAVGNTALTMPYCLIDEENGTRYPRKEVLRHVCETSVHLMGSQKGRSWLTVAKIGIYEPEELKEWVEFCQKLTGEHKFISRIVMVNVELQSRLTLHGPQVSSKPMVPISQPMVNALSTPVTTPQAVITSPDQTVAPAGATSMAANAQTPPDLTADTGGEVDAYLSDPLNEAWAMTFGFGLNQTQNPLEIRPAMASGFLLKRTTRQDSTGGLAVINVNLIAALRRGPSGVPYPEREQILQDVLMQYRGLHVLGIARRCVDEAEGCVPWHVATAFKGAKVLERLM